MVGVEVKAATAQMYRRQPFCCLTLKSIALAMMAAWAMFAAMRPAGLPFDFTHAVDPRWPVIQAMPVAVVPHALNKSETSHENDEHEQSS
jgi:hypothetical protein